jgi:hypothetical protein
MVWSVVKREGCYLELVLGSADSQLSDDVYELLQMLTLFLRILATPSICQLLQPYGWLENT